MATITTDWIYPSSAISQAVDFATEFNFGTAITGEPWSNPNSICNEDGALSSNDLGKATITSFQGSPVNLSNPSDWLICNFSALNLPSTANNIKIDVIVKRKASIINKINSGYSASGSEWGAVFLYNGNTRLGITPTTQPPTWGTALSEENFGGSSDTFDDSVTATILNSGNFKIRFWCENYDIASARTVYVDSIKFRVTYDYISSTWVPKIIMM